MEKLRCCQNTPGAFGPCCNTSHPDLCLCDDIVTQQDFQKCLGKDILIIHNLIKISPEGPDDDSEILLVATGSTSNTEFASNQVQFYEKQEHGGYESVVPEQCNLGSDYSTLPLPTASSLGTGIVVNDTIRLCEGYTTSGVRECYDIIPGQGYQARPPLDIPYGGQSVFLPEEGYNGSWWLANTKATWWFLRSAN